MIRWMTAGESHGKGLVGIIDGMPAGLVFFRCHFRKIANGERAGLRGLGKNADKEPEFAT
jgi:chorismate synthase